MKTIIALSLVLTTMLAASDVRADPILPTDEQLEFVTGMFAAHCAEDTPEHGDYVRYVDWYDCRVGCRMTAPYAERVMLVCIDPDEGWLTVQQPNLSELGW